MIKNIEKIINDGVLAPSGENCQPWKFRVDGNTLSVFNIPERDMSLYNSKQKGSYVAHGALLENIAISATSYGYTTRIQLFPDETVSTHVADVVFEEGIISQDPLYPYIKERCTNRKDFSGEKLHTEIKKEITESIGALPAFLSLIDQDHVLDVVGQALAVNERVLFENKRIHNFFYRHIIWDKKHEGDAGGFFIDTLEFLPHQLGAVKLFKHWTLLTLLNRILGVSKMISKENGQKYAQSGTFGAIIMNGKSNEDWVHAGMAIQRIWLTATKLGLSLHPCNGTIYFMEQIQDNGGKEFSKKHSTLIHSAYQDIVTGFDAEGKHIGFIFRIGKAEAPSARAKRIQPEVEFVTR